MNPSRCASFCLSLVASAVLAAPAATPLAFRIDEGSNINSFLRDGPVAAHLLLRSGTAPRILVAYPAGNSGIGVWFANPGKPLAWTLVVAPRPSNTVDEKRRPMHGIEFEVSADVAELRTDAAVLSSIRVLRDFELQHVAPPEVRAEPTLGKMGLTWSRDRLDGAAGFRLTIAGTDGTTVSAERLAAAPGKPLRLRIQATCGETPLVALASPLTAAARNDSRARQALTFLSYEDKFLAGSWRFDTYFGRDTLMSATLLAPVLTPVAIESAISSVLDRLAPNGEVAHEEDIGEFAVLRNAREGRGRIATPIYDYGMVDDDFMLAPLAARWLLDDPRGRAHAKAYLASKGAGGEARGAALVRNLVWAVERAAPFAMHPRASNLVSIKVGRMTGEWRDSEQGLGRGRFAYDVNTALVPAALEAAGRFSDAHALDAWMDDAQRRTLSLAGERAQVWATRASQLFEVDIPATQAHAAIGAYAAEAGVDGSRALAALGQQPLRFHALSLDGTGAPVPILNSDEGFRLLYTDPSPDSLDRAIGAILMPFPAGLMTDVGMLVANPAQATPDLQREFSRFAYHGTVVWSWQQALLAAGIDRQLKRTDLRAGARGRLEQARATLWAAIDSSKALRTSELWSWSYSDGRYVAEPFGRPGADVDESNAAQLWSTVYLGIGPK